MSRHAWQGPCPLTKVNSPEAIESSVTSNYPIKPFRSSNSFSMAFLLFFFPPQSLDWRNYRDRCVSSKSIQRNIISIQRQLSPFYRGEMDLFDSALIDSREKKCNAILKPIRYRIRSCTWRAIFLRHFALSLLSLSLKKGKIDSKRHYFYNFFFH